MTDINALFETQSSDIEKVLDEIEVNRKKYLPRIFFYTLTIGSLVGVVMGWIVESGDMMTMIISLAIVYLCFFLGLSSYYKSCLSDIYKEQVMPNLVNTLGKNLSETQDDTFAYSAEYKPEIETFRQCGMFGEHDDDYVTGEDNISGKIGKTEFYFCEAEYCYSVNGSERDKDSAILFNGLMFDADFNKNFNGMTLLSTLDIRNNIDEKLEDVKLEDPKFNRMFKVYATDQVEARYILSPSLQERLVKMMENLKQTSDIKRALISFFESRILILLPSNVNHFEANLFHKLSIKEVRKDFQLLNDLLSIVNELNLNVRIWTKE